MGSRLNHVLGAFPVRLRTFFGLAFMPAASIHLSGQPFVLLPGALANHKWALRVVDIG